MTQTPVSQAAITGMPAPIGVQTPVYKPANDPRCDVLTNDLTVDKDHGGYVVDDLTSTVGKAGGYWNLGDNITAGTTLSQGKNGRAQFIANSGSDYRFNLKKLAVQMDFWIKCDQLITGSLTEAPPTSFDAGTGLREIAPYREACGIPAFLPFHVVSSISLKVNDSAQAVETYDQSQNYGKLSVIRALQKYDHATLEQMSETLFTPVFDIDPNYSWAYWKDGAAPQELGFPKRSTIIQRYKDCIEPEAYQDPQEGVHQTAATQQRVLAIRPLPQPNTAVANHWPDSRVSRKIVPLGMLLEFCSADAISNNIRKLDIEMSFNKADEPFLVWNIPIMTAAAPVTYTHYKNYAVLKDVKLIVSDVRLSASQNVDYVNDKIENLNEKFAFLYAMAGEQQFNPGTQLPYMNVSNLSHAVVGPVKEYMEACTRNPDHFSDFAFNDAAARIGITSYIFRYGIDQFPTKTLPFGDDITKTLPYYLLQKVLNKECLTNFRLSIPIRYYKQLAFLLAAKFYDSTYPHLSPSKEVRIDIQGSNNNANRSLIYYALFRYRTCIVAGDGSVTIQD